MAECPECAAELELGPDVEAGEIVVCPDCGVELEVLERLRAEALAGRRTDDDTPRDADPIELAPWRFRVVR